MLGLFISTDGKVSIIEGQDFALAPERAASPHDGRTAFELLATDAVLLDGEAFCVALYEQSLPGPYERAIRTMEEKQECSE